MANVSVLRDMWYQNPLRVVILFGVLFVIAGYAFASV